MIDVRIRNPQVDEASISKLSASQRAMVLCLESHCGMKREMNGSGNKQMSFVKLNRLYRKIGVGRLYSLSDKNSVSPNEFRK